MSPMMSTFKGLVAGAVITPIIAKYIIAPRMFDPNVMKEIHYIQKELDFVGWNVRHMEEERGVREDDLYTPATYYAQGQGRAPYMCVCVVIILEEAVASYLWVFTLRQEIYFGTYQIVQYLTSSSPCLEAHATKILTTAVDWIRVRTRTYSGVSLLQDIEKLRQLTTHMRYML